jgi:hypothetical protein
MMMPLPMMQQIAVRLRLWCKLWRKLRRWALSSFGKRLLKVARTGSFKLRKQLQWHHSALRLKI